MGTITCQTCGTIKTVEGPWDTTVVYCNDCTPVALSDIVKGDTFIIHGPRVDNALVRVMHSVEYDENSAAVLIRFHWRDEPRREHFAILADVMEYSFHRA